ncbi:MAG TPA: c-type cytochrome [Terriglobia bacterium]|nr:c-type cytochrome [Terriglobia bacterium]
MRAIPNPGRTFRVLLVVACCSLPVLMAGQERQVPARRPGLWNEYPAEQVKAGRIQFQKTCAFCHGPDANGGSTGPDLMRSAVVRHDNKGDHIGPVIRSGFPDKGMPAFQLSNDQIMDIVAFLSFRLDQSDRRSPARTSASYSLSNLLVGNAKAGKEFFDGAGKCSSCHSPTGDLKGIAGKYPPAELQARMIYPRQGQRPTAAVTDATGRQYTGPIRLLTQYDIAIIDADGEYHSWPIHSVKVQINNRLAAHRQLLSVITDAEMHNLFAYLETLK